MRFGQLAELCSQILSLCPVNKALVSLEAIRQPADVRFSRGVATSRHLFFYIPRGRAPRMMTLDHHRHLGITSPTYHRTLETRRTRTDKTSPPSTTPQSSRHLTSHWQLQMELGCAKKGGLTPPGAHAASSHPQTTSSATPSAGWGDLGETQGRAVLSSAN